MTELMIVSERWQVAPQNGCASPHDELMEETDQICEQCGVLCVLCDISHN